MQNHAPTTTVVTNQLHPNTLKYSKTISGRHTHTHTHARQTGRRTFRQTDRHKDIKTDRQKETHTHRHTQTHSITLRQSQADRQIHMHARQTDRRTF